MLTKSKNETTKIFTISGSEANVTSISIDEVTFNKTNMTNVSKILDKNTESNSDITETFVVTTEIEKINGSLTKSEDSAYHENGTKISEAEHSAIVFNGTLELIAVEEIIKDSYSNSTAISAKNVEGDITTNSNRSSNFVADD